MIDKKLEGNDKDDVTANRECGRSGGKHYEAQCWFFKSLGMIKEAWEKIAIANIRNGKHSTEGILQKWNESDNLDIIENASKLTQKKPKN